MDEFDESAHTALIQDIKKLNRKARRGTERLVRLNSDIVPKIDSNEILKRIGDSVLIKKSKQQRSLPKPLEKPQAKRLKRAIGYEEAAVEAEKWGRIVNHRRKADQLKFPLEEVDVRIITTEKNYKPPMQSDLERQIYPILQGAKLIEEKKQDSEAELEVKRAMSLQEVKLKSQEIWRQRLLRQRLEKKAAQLNKSKSRKYHKILRRERLRKKKEEFENLKTSDPQKALDILNEIEKNRVQERMNLRHRKSKWLHMQTSRAGQDKNVREILQENKDTCVELLQKLKPPEVDNDDENNQNSDEEFKMTDKTELSEQPKTIDEMTEEEQQIDFANFQSKIEALHRTAKAEEKSTEDNRKDEDEGVMGSLNMASRHLGAARVQDLACIRGIFDDDSDDEDEATVGNFENIYKDDELIKDFQLEKQRREEESRRKLYEDDNMKGWGSWAGPGIQTSRRRRRKFRSTAVKLPTNTYTKKPHIIYNESNDVHQNLRKHMVNELPYPFASVKDFESSVRQPLGRIFVPEIAHKKLIAPPIIKKMGVVINAMGEEALLKNHDKYKKKVSKLEAKLNKELNPNPTLSTKKKYSKNVKKIYKKASVKPLVINK